MSREQTGKVTMDNTGPGQRQEEHHFATFMLDDLEFAVSVDHLRAAIPRPERITNLPVSPDYVLGMIELRDKIIPIIDTRRRFQMTSAGGRNGGHLAITCCHGRHFGLLFDRIREVIRVRSADMDMLAPEFQREGDLLAGIIKLEQGRRLVQIINPLSLFDYVAPAEQGEPEEPGQARPESGEERFQVVSFVSGGQQFGISVEHVREIITVPVISQKILVEKYIRGVITLRDELISVLDFFGFLSDHNSTITADSRIMILCHQGFHFGLLVDGICDVRSVYARERLPMPSWTGLGHDGGFTGVLERQRETVVLIEMAVLFAEALERLASHRDLHTSSRDCSRPSGAMAARSSDRPALHILFAAGEVYGARIEHIREVVPWSHDIRVIPGQLDFVEGLITLRAEVIPVINLRKFFGMAEAEESMERLIMILFCGDRLLGILIDRLVELREFPAESSEKMPRVLARDMAGRAYEMIERVIEATESNGRKYPVMILNMPGFMTAVTHGPSEGKQCMGGRQ